MRRKLFAAPSNLGPVEGFYDLTIKLGEPDKRETQYNRLCGIASRKRGWRYFKKGSGTIPSPLVKPDMQVSGIRFSQRLSP
jgi:hypothetical protein